MLLVGTGNQHKLSEIAAILADLPVEVVGQDHLTAAEDVEETGTTFAANAEIKARAFARRAAHLPPPRRPRWVIADDSGLCVDGLDGAPGVYSARYAGEDCTFQDNNRKLLAALADVPQRDRDAHFVCSLCCLGVPGSPDENAEMLFRCEGLCSGSIALEPSGGGGFGYDPIFLESTTGRTFAELSAVEKNSISHRGLALGKFRDRFLQLLEKER